ncbi:MAG: hypothetical protein QOG71_1969 [Pyrinomonadaceae bacterium]|nr:hypothetical protein [Pyrinomonadaceae bacterium]
MKLNPETVLRRRPYLRLALNSSDEVQVSVGERTIKCGLHALAVLELFSRPLSIADAIKQLGARYAAGERVAAIATLFRLQEGGALRDVSARDEEDGAAHEQNAAHDKSASVGGVEAVEKFVGDARSEDNERNENLSADEIYFECALDDSTRALIPYRERDARAAAAAAGVPRAAGTLQTTPTAALELNPHLFLQTGDDAPAHLAARVPFLDRFSPRRPLLWVEDTGTETLAPYWLMPEHARLFVQLKEGKVAPAELDADTSARFAEARILIAPEEDAARADNWRRACEELRRDLQSEQHAVMRKIIHPLQLAALRRYFRALDARGHLKASSNKHYAHRRRSIYDEETARFVQQQINALVNRITPAPVRPSHCQVSVYQPGAFLRRHKDQPQYVWNLSLVVDAEPESEEANAWPICVEVEGRAREVRLEIGDAVLYRGAEFTHWRDVLPDGESVTMLFCFFSLADDE